MSRWKIVMKTLTYCLAGVFGFLCVGLAVSQVPDGPQKVDVKPVFQVGDLYRYSEKIDLEGEKPAKVSLDLTLKVKSVDGDGSATIEYRRNNMTVHTEGQTMNPPDPKSKTYQVDEFGKLPDPEAKINVAGNVLAMVVSLAQAKVPLGEPVKVDIQFPNKPGHIYGTYEFDPADNGTLKVKENLTFEMSPGVQKPTTIVGNEVIDAKTHVLKSETAELTNIDPSNSGKFNSVHIVVSPRS